MPSKPIKFLELADLLEREFAILPADSPAITLNELIDRFGVSRGTAKRTLLELQQRGVIYSRVGSGSFVAPPQRRKQIIIVFDLNRTMQQRDVFNEKFLVRALIRCNMCHPQYTVSAMDFSDFLRDADHLSTLNPRLKGAILLREATPYREAAEWLAKRGVACAFYGSSTYRNAFGSLDSLVYDEDKIMESVLGVLHERGCTVPGFVGNLSFPVSQERFRCFRKHAARLGMTFPPHQVLEPENTDFSDRKLLRRYFCELDSIVASDDKSALVIAQQAQALGFKIPDDIAITGVNNIPYLELLSPPGITTVDLNTECDAERAVDLLIRRIETGEPFREYTAPQLIRRGSA